MVHPSPPHYTEKITTNSLKNDCLNTPNLLPEITHEVDDQSNISGRIRTSGPKVFYINMRRNRDF